MSLNLRSGNGVHSVVTEPRDKALWHDFPSKCHLRHLFRLFI